MKKKNMANSLTVLVVFDDPTAEQIAKAEECGIELHSYSSLLEQGAHIKASEFKFRETQPDDVYVLVFTSGTTGDSKGAKITHRNMFSDINGTKNLTFANPDDVHFSFIPYAHSFE
jgi:long-chain acyl-CoA synthetase